MMVDIVRPPNRILRLDQNNRFGRSVVFASLPGQMPGTDLRTKQDPTVTSPTYTFGPYGAGVLYASTGGSVFTGLKPIPKTQDGFTSVIIAAPSAEARMNVLLFMGDESGSPFTQSTFAANYDTSIDGVRSGYLSYFEYTGVFSAKRACAPGIVDGQPHVFILVRNPGAATPDIYVDGMASTGASTVGGMVSLPAGVGVGSTNKISNSRSCAGPLYLAYVLDRAIDVSEVIELTRNPHQIIDNKQRSLVGVAAVGSQSIVGAGAIASAEAFGLPTVTPGSVSITGAGAIASAEAFGSSLVGQSQTLSSVGAIASAEAFGQRTNYYLQSESFDNAAWTKLNGSIIANAVANPLNGASTAAKLVENSVFTSHQVIQNVATVGQLQTISIYAKAGERLQIFLQLGLNSAYFNLITQNISNSNFTAATILPLSNGWFRCAGSVIVSTSTSTSFRLASDSRESYQGDGFSGLYIFGAMLEDGDTTATVGSAYIPTTTSAVTVFSPNVAPVVSAAGNITSAEVFGSQTVTPGAVTLTGVGNIVSAETFGTHTVASAAGTVFASGIVSDETWGGLTVAPGPVTVSGAGNIVSAEAFGSAKTNLQVSVVGVASGEAFGTTKLTLFVTAVGNIPSGEAIGAAMVELVQAVLAQGIGSSESFGADFVLPGAVTVSPAGISSSEVFGSASFFVEIILPNDMAVRVIDSGKLEASFASRGELAGRVSATDDWVVRVVD